MRSANVCFEAAENWTRMPVPLPGQGSYDSLDFPLSFDRVGALLAAAGKEF